MSLYIPDPKRFIQIPYTAYTHIEEDDLSNSDKSFLSTAAKAALSSSYKFRMAAMIVKSGRVLSINTNLNKRSPTTPPNRWSTHAEIRALRSASETKDTTLYIARIAKNGDYACAKPCAWCMEHILTAKVDRVVFTVNNDFSSSFYTEMISWI
jgi:tRNA(Arg) A34 adenosine deaminase TadA